MVTKVTTSNIFIGIMSAMVCIPFLYTIFYIRTLDAFLGLLLGMIIAALIIITFIVYCFIERRKNFRIGVLAGIFGALVIFIFSFGFQLDAADYLFYKLREKKFNELVTEIKKYGKITSMSDGNRYSKSLNDSIYEFEDKDMLKDNRKGVHLYADLLKELDIDEKIHQDFRNRLTQLDCISFNTYPDGAVSFTIDGWIDSCYGLTYSPIGEKHSDDGRVIVWKHIEGSWYAWGN